MNKMKSLSLAIIMLTASLAGCLGDSDEKEDDSDENIEEKTNTTGGDQGDDDPKPGGFRCPSDQYLMSAFELGLEDDWDLSIWEINLPYIPTGLSNLISPDTTKVTDVKLPMSTGSESEPKAFVAHHFEDIAPYQIRDAQLTIKTRTIQGDKMPTGTIMNGDDIRIGFHTMPQIPMWTIPIGPDADTPNGITKVIPLDAMPTSGTGSLSNFNFGNYNMIPNMNALNYLDIIVGFGQQVDYINLDVCYELLWTNIDEDGELPCENWDDPLATTYQTGDVVEILHGDIDNFDQTNIDPSPDPRRSLIGVIDWQQTSLARSGSGPLPIAGQNSLGFSSSTQAPWNSWGEYLDYGTLSEFDQLDSEMMLFTSFQNLPNNIVDARLEFRVKFIGGNSITDSLVIGFTQDKDPPDTYPYHNSDTLTGGDYFDNVAISPLDTNFGLAANTQLITYPYTVGTAQNVNAAGGLTVSLGLSNLHPAQTYFESSQSLQGGLYSIIQEMNQEGFLDFIVQDDTAVDYVKLIYCTADFDTDGDGYIDSIQDKDDDNDGIPNDVDGDADIDGDGIPNHLDDDSDGDGIPDSVEGPGDSDGDGTPDFLDSDSDGDGILDTYEGTGDVDGDGTPNYLDDDSDGDGIPDSVEGSVDSDGDGVPDFLDNDSDNDGIPDNVEGLGDSDGDGIPDYQDTDSDGDGILDSVEGTVDTDGDGIPNYLDTDSDGDGIPDDVERNVLGNDWDGDGIPNYLDTDSDGDGILDSVEGTVDTDGDGIPDYLDTDSDGDGILDSVEGTVDTDGDGIPDYLDTDSDGDGMPDYWELANGLDPYDSSDAIIDNDNDGLTNLQEYEYLTDPNNPDTDGGGVNDGDEVSNMSDPNDDSDDGNIAG